MKTVIRLLRKLHEVFTMTIIAIICASLTIIGIDIDPESYEEDY